MAVREVHRRVLLVDVGTDVGLTVLLTCLAMTVLTLLLIWADSGNLILLLAPADLCSMSVGAGTHCS